MNFDFDDNPSCYIRVCHVWNSSRRIRESINNTNTKAKKEKQI